MQKFIRVSILSFILFLSVSFAFSSSVTKRETIQQEFEVTGIQSVAVINGNGNIDLRTGGNKISLTAVRQVTAGTIEAAYKSIDRTAIYVRKVGSRLQFDSPVPEGMTAYKVDYVLYVPAGMLVDLRTVNGKVICKDRKPPFKIESGGSAIVTIGGKEVTATVSETQSDSAIGGDKISDDSSSFSKVNGALDALMHSIPSVTKLLHSEN